MTGNYEAKLLPLPIGHHLADQVLAICNFCKSRGWSTNAEFQRNSSLAHGRYYCTFCLRHNHHYKNSKDILIMNFLGIISYYYHISYQVEPRTIWLSQIARLIQNHETTGLACPLFSYNQSNGLWFVNFNKVGQGRSEIPISHIQDIIVRIINSFKLPENAPEVQEDAIIQKYREAVALYYEQRQRPNNRKILAPTLKNCLLSGENPPTEPLKNSTFLSILGSTPHNNWPITLEDITDVNKITKYLNISIKKKTVKGVRGYEGIIDLPGCTRFKVTDNFQRSFFASQSQLKAHAMILATSLHLTPVFSEPIAKPRAGVSHK